MNDLKNRIKKASYEWNRAQAKTAREYAELNELCEELREIEQAPMGYNYDVAGDCWIDPKDGQTWKP